MGDRHSGVRQLRKLIRDGDWTIRCQRQHTHSLPDTPLPCYCRESLECVNTSDEPQKYNLLSHMVRFLYAVRALWTLRSKPGVATGASRSWRPNILVSADLRRGLQLRRLRSHVSRISWQEKICAAITAGGGTSERAMAVAGRLGPRPREIESARRHGRRMVRHDRVQPRFVAHLLGRAARSHASKSALAYIMLAFPNGRAGSASSVYPSDRCILQIRNKLLQHGERAGCDRARAERQHRGLFSRTPPITACTCACRAFTG